MWPLRWQTLETLANITECFASRASPPFETDPTYELIHFHSSPILLFFSGIHRQFKKKYERSPSRKYVLRQTVYNSQCSIERKRERDRKRVVIWRREERRTRRIGHEHSPLSRVVSGVASCVRIEGRQPTNRGRPIDRDEGREARRASYAGGRTLGVAAQAAAPSKAPAPLEPAKRIPDATEETTNARRSRDTRCC